MKKYIKAFTLVELIVGITISMILMMSVSIFVGNGIKNITNQKISLENDSKVKDITKVIYESLSFIDKTFGVTIVDSGALFKVNKDYDKGGFSFIGSGSFYRYYCQSGSESAKETTAHIYLKTFFPFEGEGGDIFDFFNFDSGGIKTNMFSGTINNSGVLVGPTDVTFSPTNGYVSDTLGHSIYSFVKSPFGNFKKIAGKEVFGDEFSDGNAGTGVFLNNPTGLEYATIGSSGYLFISDTLNDRILYLSLGDNKIYKLLGREDGLKEPTGIYYNDSQKTLYIANSGKGQILSYSSSGSFVDNVNLNFTPKNNITGVNKLDFSFYYASGFTNPTLTGPSNTGSFNFSNIMAGEDLLETPTHDLIYHFVDYTAIASPQGVDCLIAPFPKYIINSAFKPVKCIQSQTGIVGDYRYQTFIGGTNYNIKINNISGSDFLNNGSYYINLKLLSGSTIKKSYYFPYFSKSDDYIFTKSDNILKILTGGLGYPTGIYAAGNNLVFNDFLNRKKIEITKTGSFVSNTDLTLFDFSKLMINPTNDSILYTPVKNYDINKVGNLLNIYINYYKNFGCYNDDNMNQTKELILKKSF